MRKLTLLLVAVLAINTVEAQRNRTRTNNNNRQERVRTTQHRERPAVRTRRVQRLRPRTRIVPRNVIRVVPQRRGRFYNNRFVYRGFGIYNRPGFGILSNPILQPTIESVEAEQERLENALELVRARKLFKYLNRPSKRNKRKLVKYNILTGRDADDITS